MNTKLKWLLALLYLALNLQSALVQSNQDIFDAEIPITWLGLDYTQAKFIGFDTAKGIRFDAQSTMTLFFLQSN